MVLIERAMKHIKTWAYVGSNEVRLNSVDLISSIFLVVAHLTNVTNVPITTDKSSRAPAVEPVVTFTAPGITAYRDELHALAAKHNLLFVSPIISPTSAI